MYKRQVSDYPDAYYAFDMNDNPLWWLPENSLNRDTVVRRLRNVLGYKDANSREMDEKTPHNVIDIMEEQKNISRCV